jgi:hypothetical protein
MYGVVVIYLVLKSGVAVPMHSGSFIPVSTNKKKKRGNWEPMFSLATSLLGWSVRTLLLIGE